MTGNPLLRLLILLVAMASLGWVVSGMTRDRVLARMEQSAEVDAGENVNRNGIVELTFDSPVDPETVEVELEGKLIGSVEGASFQKPISFSTEDAGRGMDLVIRGVWPATGDGSNALRVQVVRDGIRILDSTLWGDPDVEDVISIPGGGAL